MNPDTERLSRLPQPVWDAPPGTQKGSDVSTMDDVTQNLSAAVCDEVHDGMVIAEIASDIKAIKKAAAINRRLQTICSRGLTRFRSALALCSHVDFGRVQSWQMSMVGLFACFDCFFPQPSPRVANQLPQAAL